MTEDKKNQAKRNTPSIRAFAEETKLELNKVLWPKRKEVLKLTAVILLIVAVFSLYIIGIDAMLIKFYNLLR